MANYPVPDSPRLNLYGVRMLESSDRGHADLFNSIFQPILENEAYLNEVCKQVSAGTSTIVGDLTKLSFQLELANLVDTSTMNHVIVDEIDSADAIRIVSGIFADNRVYI